jgi:predicted dinucleotide-binding enzyme
MRVGVIGSGSVGQALGAGLIKSGHEVKIGTGHPDKLNDWKQKVGEKGSVGSFAEAAKFGEMVFLATKWDGGATENAINLAGKENFRGKVVVDVTNTLVFDAPGQPPKMGIGWPQSAGLLVQQWLPEAVKAFNSVTARYMADAHLKEGKPVLFIAGNDAGAKKTVTDIAAGWGWQVVDIGGIEQSYLLEAMAMLWVRYGFLNNTWTHAFALLKG